MSLVYLVEPEAKQLKSYLNEDKLPEYDTVNTVADGIRVLRVGDLCKPILAKYAAGNIISVVR